MSGKIYLLDEGSRLRAMTESAYDSEKLLQRLLAEYPDLLAGDQMNPENPRRWLLVAQEMSVPDGKGGSKRWSLDHLFLDQDAIPTLVEVKRSSDTRIRREVVGQMMDYAANGVAHWPLEEIVAKFKARCAARGLDPEQELAALLDETQDADDYWAQVKKNLAEGRVRIVFLADAIPSELRSIVEFLNEQMDRSEVLAIEVKQFVGEGVTALVPRVLGQSERALKKKAATAGPRTDIAEAEFLAHVAATRPPEERRVFEQFIAWARKEGLEDSFTKGPKGFQFLPILRVGAQSLRPANVNAKGWVRISMRSVRIYSPFDEPASREELFQKIKHLPDLELTDAGMEGFPKIPIPGLTDDRQLSSLLAALSWLVAQLRRTRR
jgi:hypothetical protein